MKKKEEKKRICLRKNKYPPFCFLYFYSYLISFLFFFFLEKKDEGTIFRFFWLCHIYFFNLFSFFQRRRKALKFYVHSSFLSLKQKWKEQKEIVVLSEERENFLYTPFFHLKKNYNIKRKRV